jgi:hypothetical protein
MAEQLYLVEARDANGVLNPSEDYQIKKKHPFLASKMYFTKDELLYWASFGEGRNNPISAYKLGEFLLTLGLTYRHKYW